MLQPKRTAYRKAHKGRIHGVAKGGTDLNFGQFGLKAQEPERITARQIEAARRAMTRYMKRAGTTSETTFKIRAGGSASGTTTFNGTGENRVLGGTLPLVHELMIDLKRLNRIVALDETDGTVTVQAGLPLQFFRSSGIVDLALFKGGHDIIYDAGLAWLFRRLEPTPSDDGKERR